MNSPNLAAPAAANALLERLAAANRGSQLAEPVNLMHDYYHWLVVDYPQRTASACGALALVLLLWAFVAWPALRRWHARHQWMKDYAKPGTAPKQPIDAYHVQKRYKGQ